MIIDVHTHTPTHRDVVPDDERIVNHAWRPDRPVVPTTTWADYDAAAAVVDLSIVFNIAVDDPFAATGLPTNPARINESTAEFAAAAPERRIGFMSVNPDRPGALEEVERCHQDLGLRGIKLGPNYQIFDPLGEGALALYALASELELPMLFHQGASPIREAPLRYAHPLLMDEIAIRFPELRIVMAHMGHPWVRETVVTIRKHPHLYADVSALCLRKWLCYEALLFATEWNAMDKLLLGSDYPIITAQETIDGVRNVNQVIEGTGMPRIDADAIERLITRDSLSLLGLR
jgi:predicted TIM-barrel fold metal-dependent hydrolase